MPLLPAVRARRRAGPAAVAAAAALALLAGCAGADASGTGVASLPSGSASASPSTGATNDPVKYSQCMRAHGVTKFPDPGSNGGIAMDAGKLGVDPRSAVFKAAEKACESVRPKGPPPDPKLAAEAQQRALAYSKCMRSHGVKNFPDPKFDGNSTSLSLPKSVRPNSPQFKAADAVCKKLMPGPSGGGPARAGPGSGTSDGGTVDSSSGGTT